jgi:DNA-directed RNA polymerase subunit RPC12/RpoP
VPGEVKCPHCGAEVEMWSTDTKATCPKCSKTFTRDQLAAKK